MSSKSVLCALSFALAVSSLASAGSEDRTILVLLKNVPGAPTPEEVVDYVDTWPHAGESAASSIQHQGSRSGRLS